MSLVHLSVGNRKLPDTSYLNSHFAKWILFHRWQNAPSWVFFGSCETIYLIFFDIQLDWKILVDDHTMFGLQLPLSFCPESSRRFPVRRCWSRRWCGWRSTCPAWAPRWCCATMTCSARTSFTTVKQVPSFPDYEPLHFFRSGAASVWIVPTHGRCASQRIKTVKLHSRLWHYSCTRTRRSAQQAVSRWVQTSQVPKHIRTNHIHINNEPLYWLNLWHTLTRAA